MHTKSFLATYTAEIGRSLINDFDDNFDEDRFGPEVRPSGVSVRIRGLARAGINRLRLQRVGASALIFDTALSYVDGFIPRLEWLFQRLGDDESRRLLVQIVAYRALGHRKVRLPLSTPSFWGNFRNLKSQPPKGESIPAQFMGWQLQRLDLAQLGTEITLFTTPMGAYLQFGLQQCRCQTAGGSIEARDGDYVIDGGGCWGDTALYLAERIGEDGRVATFEFVPANLEVMTRNFALNSHLAKRIEIVHRALWHQSDLDLNFDSSGPGSTVSDNAGKMRVASLAIDDLLREGCWPRLDFIKLDIEGAELAALRGAEKSIRQFRPRMAIALYHRFEDFFTIPSFVDSLNLNYRFYLRHFTIHSEETMLFASAE